MPLTRKTTRQIRRLWRLGVKPLAIAAEVGCAESTVRKWGPTKETVIHAYKGYGPYSADGKFAVQGNAWRPRGAACAVLPR